MKLVTFTHEGSTRIGVVAGEEIADVGAASPALPSSLLEVLRGGAAAIGAVHTAATDAPRVALDQVHLEAPVQTPGKILAVGLNYGDHIEETGMDKPKVPVIFNKQTTSVHPPFDAFHLPRASSALDYEGELAVVIGRRCRHVPRERAREVIAGYTIVNDVTIRDWQLRSPTMTMGKSWDTHCPMGPWLVTADEVPDPHCLDLKTWVNGELRQSSNTKHLIFDIDTLVEHLSTAFTLEPGDVIATGTPSGVGIAMKPPKLLQAGDRVRIAVDAIGEIEAEVIDEPEGTARID